MSDVPKEALAAVPIFPLQSTVLLPGTFVSLHIFEPRYRAMMDYLIEGHRHLVVATICEGGDIDDHGRPPLYDVAGIGVLRRSVRLPDGRFDIVLEGLARVDISEELPPELVFRRARAELIEDALPDAPQALTPSMVSVRALCHRALMQSGDGDPELLETLATIEEPGRLADLVAAAAFQEVHLRQQVLEESCVSRRLEHVAGALGAQLLITASEESGAPPLGWGIGPGEA